MEFFLKAKAVRLRSHHDKYLIAEEDEESVTQERNGSAGAAKWTVELVPGSTNLIRLKSAYGKYLTASNKPFLLGATGKKVLQTKPSRLDSSLAWEPIRDCALIKLKTRYGHFLRGNGGLPPWRNSVTHDIPQRSATQEWILWHVDVVEILNSDCQQPPSPLHHSDSLDFAPGSPSRSNRFFRQEVTFRSKLMKIVSCFRPIRKFVKRTTRWLHRGLVVLDYLLFSHFWQKLTIR